uniref:Butyrophilin-like protein 10 n=1 Tax=Xenopus tropicalis TaxID=8364 RepID=A0A803JBK1_XENTR
MFVLYLPSSNESRKIHEEIKAVPICRERDHCWSRHTDSGTGFTSCRLVCLLVIMGPAIPKIVRFFGLFILCSMFEGSLSVRFTVSSTTSVVAALGSDVLLPCHLIPEMNAEKMEIRWFKPTYQPYVHLYINGKDDYTAQMPQFANRTELLKDNITRGIFPLKIRNVTAQDSGEYYCFVESTEHHGKATVQLQVTAVGSLPVISPNTYTSNDTAFCVSCGWLPEPSLIWTDTQGIRVISSMENVYKDKKSLYCIFSIISLPDSSNITCTVSNSISQMNQSCWRIRETGLPVTCRDLYSRYIVFWPCLAALIVCIGCLCHQSKELRNKNEEIKQLLAALGNLN